MGVLEDLEHALVTPGGNAFEAFEAAQANVSPTDPIAPYVSLYWLRWGGGTDEARHRETLAAAVPDSVYVAWSSFEARKRKGDLIGSLETLERVEALRRSPGAFDRRVAPILEKMGCELGSWTVRREQVRVLMQLGRMEEALPLARDWADEPGPSDPPWLPSLQVAFLLTALHRHAEAVEAYGVAIERVENAPDLVVVGDDQRALAWFNRACERAIQGERGEPVLADLREAVRRNPALVEEARRDDYLAGVRSDPAFEAALTEGLSGRQPPGIDATEAGR